MDQILKILISGDDMPKITTISSDDIEDEDSRLILTEGHFIGKKYVWDNGSWYNGQYIMNHSDRCLVAHGRGVYNIEDEDCKQNSVFVGYFDDGMFIEGSYVGDDGEGYIGEWKDDISDGVGTYFYKNGDRLTGRWEEGIPEGWCCWFYKKPKNNHKGYTCYYDDGEIILFGKLLY